MVVRLGFPQSREVEIVGSLGCCEFKDCWEDSGNRSNSSVKACVDFCLIECGCECVWHIRQGRSEGSLQVAPAIHTCD